MSDFVKKNNFISLSIWSTVNIKSFYVKNGFVLVQVYKDNLKENVISKEQHHNQDIQSTF